MPTEAAQRIVSPIDDLVRVKISKSTPAMTKNALDIGHLDGNTMLERIILMLAPGPEREFHLRTFLDSQQSKGSPDYHRWLTPEEFGQQFGPSSQDVIQVQAWLVQHGFTVGHVAKSGRWLEFSGTAAQVEETFQTSMRSYSLYGELHIANDRDISIPEALSPVVQGVFSLHDFRSKPLLRRFPQSRPLATDGTGDHFLTPGDVAAIYGLTPLFKGTAPSPVTAALTGTGQTIAIVAAGNINTLATTGVDDVGNFRSLFALPPSQPHIILNGPDPGVLPGFSDEATLDVEYAGSTAPMATIDVVVSSQTLTTDAVPLSSSYIVDQNLASIMSVSFSSCEAAQGPSGNAFWSSLWQQAAAQGISVFVAAGDTGAAGCEPNAPSVAAASGGLEVNAIASTPFDTAVGGTEFDEGATPAIFWGSTNGPGLSSAVGYIPEKVWNDSCSPSDIGSFCQTINLFDFSAGSGGISSIYTQTQNLIPSYQTLPIQGLSGQNFPGRSIPDVSLASANSHDPYIFCFSTDPTQPDCVVSGQDVTVHNIAGGTSFASPEFAGIMALVDQATGERQGLANYVLYALAAAESPNFGNCNSSNRIDPATPPNAACVFNDVTKGSNGVPGNDVLSIFVPAEDGDVGGQVGYNAGPGYEPAVGLGSINAAALLSGWINALTGFQGSQITLSASFNGTPLPSNAVSISHGQPISVSVNVARQGLTGTPAGSVALIAQGGNLASAVGIASESIHGTNGSATTGLVNVNNLPGGASYNLIANFPGDGVFAGSTSNAIAITVTPESSATTLHSFLLNANTQQTTPNPVTIAYGDSTNILLIDAAAAGASGLAPAAGSISFAENGSVLAQIPVNNAGAAEFVNCSSASCLAPGQTHTIAASYSGDGLSYHGSSSAASITITVTKGNPRPGVVTPVNAGFGVSFNLQTFIGNGVGTTLPTGTVQFLDGGAPLGAPTQVTASGGRAQAVAQVTLSALGTHSIQAQYSGDSIYNPATSSPAAMMTVGPFGFSGSASQTISPGQTANYPLVLNQIGGFTGQISFTCTGAPAGATCGVSPNPATLSPATLSEPFTVSVSNTGQARLLPRSLPGLPFVFTVTVALGLALARRKTHQKISVFLATLVILSVSSCGNHTTGSGGTGTGNTESFTLILTGTSGANTGTTTLTLNVTH